MYGESFPSPMAEPGAAWAYLRGWRKPGAERHLTAGWARNGRQLVAGERAVSVLCLTSRRFVDTAPLHPVGRS